MEVEGSSSRMVSVLDDVLVFIFSYLQETEDRNAISRVNRRFSALEASTRRHVSIPLCYSSGPVRLRQRFPHLISLKLKGNPRVAQIYERDTYSSVTEWVKEISDYFFGLRFIDFRGMKVLDSDLEVIAHSRGPFLEELKLRRCSGFSTDGLFHIARNGRNLKTLFLKKSSIEEKDGNWLHELATSNTVLENLNMYRTELSQIRIEDLELLASNCPSLTSMGVGECEFLDLEIDLERFFHIASSLTEFYGGFFKAKPWKYRHVVLPMNICHLGLGSMGRNEMRLISPIADKLVKLDVVYARLGSEDLLSLFSNCHNLEVVEVRKNFFGDAEIEVLASCCKRLKCLKMKDSNENGQENEGQENEVRFVTEIGLIMLSEGCEELQQLVLYVMEVSNYALYCIGTLKNLCDFRLFLDYECNKSDFPLDKGVKRLLKGCSDNLTRLTFCFDHGALTKDGLGYIGKYSPKVKRMHLKRVGDSANGLENFTYGCPSLQILEITGAPFREETLAEFVLQHPSLRYLWIDRCQSSEDIDFILQTERPSWMYRRIRGNRFSQVLSRKIEILGFSNLARSRKFIPDNCD